MLKERLEWIKSIDIYDYNTKINEPMDRIFEINFGKKVIELQSGDFFGEKALETSAPRNATIITTSNCDFIMLKKKDYISKVREAFKRKKKQLFNFYERILKIKTTNFGENKSVYSIMRSFEEKNCSFGEIILDHLKDKNKILLLREGKCCNFIGKYLMYKTINISEIDSDFYSDFTLSEKKNIFSVLNGKKIKICEILGNAIIGEEMLIKKNQTFDISINCLSAFGKYFQLKENALNNLPLSLRRDFSRMICIKRKTRIQNFKKIVKLMLHNFQKIPKKLIFKYVHLIIRSQKATQFLLKK